MPTLRFHSPESLRLALASGIVPESCALSSVLAGSDEAGAIWLQCPELLARDAIKALVRIGATIHGPDVGPPLETVACWAELLPCKASLKDLARATLAKVADRHAAELCADLVRLTGIAATLVMLPGTTECLISHPEMPTYFQSKIPDFGGSLYAVHAKEVWVQTGYEHPHLAGVPSPKSGIVLIPGIGTWQRWPEVRLPQTAKPFVLRQTSSPSRNPSPQASSTRGEETSGLLQVRVSLRLAHTRAASSPPTLWCSALPPQELLSSIVDSPERMVRKHRVAVVEHGATAMTFLQVEAGATAASPLLPELRGYTPWMPGSTLFIPEGCQLTPGLRAKVLASILGFHPATTVVLQPTSSGEFETIRFPTQAFRPLSDWLRYKCPKPCELQVQKSDTTILALPRFVGLPDGITTTRPREMPTTVPPTTVPKAEPRVGALAETLRRVAGKLWARKAKKTVQRKTPIEVKLPEEAPDRMRDKLASPQALLMGNEWAARRLSLEQRILTDLPHLSTHARASLWNDLGDVYMATGQARDAAVCRLNATWDDETTPAHVEAWFVAECRVARIPRDGLTGEKLLSTARGVPTAQVALAYLCHKAITTSNEPEATLAGLMKLIAASEAELPVRGVWLAYLAVARLSGGDLLGLAQARDRVFARLLQKGPGLDLDAPSFLRFRGIASGDRFVTARDWLLRIREPMQHWLGKLATAGKLQWAGIDGEAKHTAAYADLMLAWGLSKLGDRSRAKDLELHARQTLTHPSSAGVDSQVHTRLLGLFLERIHAAQNAIHDAPLPALNQVDSSLDDLGRYAIDKLRSQLGILDPSSTVNAFAGRDCLGFLGTDTLGLNLREFLFPKHGLPDAEDARRFLAIDEADPTAMTMPRIIFAMLEKHKSLDAQLLAAVIPQMFRAIELIPEWVRLGLQSSEPTTVLHRFGRRMILAGCQAANRFHLAASMREATEHLIERCDSPDSPSVQLLEPVVGTYFRTLRRLGLTPLAEVLASRLRPGTTAGARELGLAVGYFAAGQEDAGNRILDFARDRLFVRGIRDERERTTVALAYAAALEHAPPRMALGRLEELFLRLEMVSSTGATNRYYTLAPLKLIDTVIRTVVSDEFSVGPGVRGWLDDDQFLIRRRITRDLATALEKLPS